ncbi:MAG: hypothetical protein B6D39_04400 [Anaerolineae bacterium UTCFX2]|jgi:hypothetical protein|nr:hypothetical protein [Anaerolineales bacterium]OQY92559.1 MAG: hypothetical protein B6D39_04400 [Anaerolineae bacterium UTCFX2]
MHDLLISSLRTLNSFLAAGIAITAFSLLLYALSFNLRDWVARSFTIILACVVTVFVGEALSSVAPTQELLEFWLHFQWVGIIILPAAYLHFSDALLATTGRPSRGRRRIAIRLMDLIAIGFLLALPTGFLVGPMVAEAVPIPHLQRTGVTWVFALFYAIAMLVSWINFWRAYKRTVTSTTRRRMTYLIAGALAPALGSYPYLLFGSGIAARSPLLFWFTVTFSNLLITFLLVLMAYAVAFFGVPWPDRVVKRRLFKWLMRGPVTASTVLVLTTTFRRLGVRAGVDLSAIIPVIMVGAILLLEHLITLVAPIWERWLFFGKDRSEMELLQTLDERLLTLGDLQQFLEAILAAVCDRLQAPQAFIATLGSQEIETLIIVGGEKSLKNEDFPVSSIRAAASDGGSRPLFAWGDYWIVPLTDLDDQPNDLIGLLGVWRHPDQELDHEQLDDLLLLSRRAALAIGDRYRQEQAFSSLEELSPEIEMIQRLRAASRYAGTDVLTSPEIPIKESDLSSLVKDALTHYWGGPKLTGSPLLNLRVVRQTAQTQKESSINALRSILRKAIEHVRPEGERRFTADWILYNILEMKFLEGRKVREVAMRLAMSEADLYRKQRVAIEAVAQAIIEMEQDALREGSLPGLDDLNFKQKIEEYARGGVLNGE